MIDRRLFQLIPKKPLILLVLLRLLQLTLSVVMWFAFARFLSALREHVATSQISQLILIGCGVLLIKSLSTFLIERYTFQSSAALRINLRATFTEKTFRLGKKSPQQLSPSALAQLTVDGIEQLEVYYSRFLPQLFYCLLASLLIFAVLAYFAFLPALILLLCMPLIPLVIMSIMKLAKKILGAYWGRYTDLGAKFHENLSGLSTLIAYGQDAAKEKEMAQEAESFRKVTMRLLAMQLNSITIMDIVSYCGAALGIGLALLSFASGNLSFVGMIMFILLSAEFFIPMRQLGSLFHVAMNGVSACQKLFDYLDIPEAPEGKLDDHASFKPLEEISAKDVTFTYRNDETPALKGITATIKQGEFTAFVGKSGSGKSTFAALLACQSAGFTGSILWNETPCQQFRQDFTRRKAFKVDNHAYLYPISIKENLLLAKKDATDDMLWHVLEKVALDQFVRQLPHKLDECLDENASNLSGGQRQRLILARALLADADFYIFDEITSGIDLHSEEKILQVIQSLAAEKIVIFISHRLYNVLNAQRILVFEDGQLTGQGTPHELRQSSAFFKTYFEEEQAILQGGEPICQSAN